MAHPRPHFCPCPHPHPTPSQSQSPGQHSCSCSRPVCGRAVAGGHVPVDSLPAEEEEGVPALPRKGLIPSSPSGTQLLAHRCPSPPAARQVSLQGAPPSPDQESFLPQLVTFSSIYLIYYYYLFRAAASPLGGSQGRKDTFLLPPGAKTLTLTLTLMGPRADAANSPVGLMARVAAGRAELPAALGGWGPRSPLSGPWGTLRPPCLAQSHGMWPRGTVLALAPRLWSQGKSGGCLAETRGSRPPLAPRLARHS